MSLYREGTWLVRADGSRFDLRQLEKLTDYDGTPPTGGDAELDTGWRIIPLAAGAGAARIRRVGNLVTFALDDWIHKGQYATHVAALPDGFRPTGKRYFITADAGWGSIPSIFGMYSGSFVSWLRRIDGNPERPSTPQSGEVQFLTDEPEPTIYPGTPG